MTDRAPVQAQRERINRVMRHLGFMPDAEDRLRRLELGLAFICEEQAQLYERFDVAVDRLVEVEASMGRLRRGR